MDDQIQQLWAWQQLVVFASIDMLALLLNLVQRMPWENLIHRLALLRSTLWPMKLDISKESSGRWFKNVYLICFRAHSLGMHHDATGNDCPSEGYVMSPTRGTEGETSWSWCSANVISQLNWAKCLQDKPTNTSVAHNSWKFEGYPGQIITAKRQCELLLV